MVDDDGVLDPAIFTFLSEATRRMTEEGTSTITLTPQELELLHNERLRRALVKSFEQARPEPQKKSEAPSAPSNLRGQSRIAFALREHKAE